MGGKKNTNELMIVSCGEKRYNVYDLQTVNADISYVLFGADVEKRGDYIIDTVGTVVCSSGVCECLFLVSVYSKTPIYEMQCCDMACYLFILFFWCTTDCFNHCGKITS